MVHFDLNKILCLTVLIVSFVLGNAQAPVTLKFTGKNQFGQHATLNSVTVENVTRHWQEVLYYPDTTLIMGTTGIEDVGQGGNGVRLFQNVPNPFDGVTDFALYLPEASAVTLEICDLNGNVTANYSGSLDPGGHRFRSWFASPQTYLLNARTDDGTVRIKMVNAGHAGQNRIEYLGKGSISPFGKADGDSKGSTDLPFSPGDLMSYKGYALFEGTQYESAPVERQQYNSELIPLTFTLPHPPFYCGIDSVADYDGNVYPTIEIGQQCWMRENLRTTHYPDGTEIPIGGNFFNDGLFHNLAYIYSPNDNSALVPEYGYLYNWVAATHGAAASNANPSGVQGVCPDGWHVPSRAELVQLISFVNSQSHFWYDDDISGKVTKALVSKNGWALSTGGFAGYDPSTNNATGFSLKPAGSDLGYGLGAYVVSTSQYIYSNGNVGAYFLSNGCEADPNLNDSHSLHTYPRSVRCVLDEPEVDSSVAVAPVVNTLKIDSVMSSTAACIGFVTATGGAVLTARGVCWSTTPHPTVSDNHTNDGTCTGRIQSSMGNLIPGTTYYVRAYATNSVGTAYGEELSFTTYAPTACGGYTVTDYDGNVYHTLPLGQQCWLQENMRTTHFADGTWIAAGQSVSDAAPYRYAPYGDSNVPTYGYLYNWAAVTHRVSSDTTASSVSQGVCPTGWHVPNTDEWIQLANYVGSQPQYVCNGDSSLIAKALASPKNWKRSTNACAAGYEPETNNTTGFSALPTGGYNGSSPFTCHAFFWSALSAEIEYPSQFHFMYYTDSVYFSAINNDAFPVRCLRDM